MLSISIARPQPVTVCFFSSPPKQPADHEVLFSHVSQRMQANTRPAAGGWRLSCHGSELFSATLIKGKMLETRCKDDLPSRRVYLDPGVSRHPGSIRHTAELALMPIRIDLSLTGRPCSGRIVLMAVPLVHNQWLCRSALFQAYFRLFDLSAGVIALSVTEAILRLVVCWRVDLITTIELETANKVRLENHSVGILKEYEDDEADDPPSEVGKNLC